MKWFAKKVFDGGGNDLKNPCKSYGYFFKIFNLVKIRKILAEKTSKPSDRCTENNTASRRCLVNKKLRFAAYERRASAGRYFSKFPLSWVCEKIQNLYQKLRFAAYDRIRGVGSRATHFGHYITVLFQKFPLRVANRGAILIEFAICMPILIILLFYISDLVKIKRYYSQTEFVGQQMANILQNISQKRTDKKITISDMKRAGALAYHSVYPGQTMFYDGTGCGYELSHRPYMMIFYAKGESGSKASVKWSMRVWNYNDKAPTMRCDTLSAGWGLVQFKTNVAPSDIYSSLKINEGESKILMEVCLTSQSNTFNTHNNISSVRQAFGCYFVNPKRIASNHEYFRSVVIFTPKPGLFDETAPS